jgi:hypothetical protein
MAHPINEKQFAEQMEVRDLVTDLIDKLDELETSQGKDVKNESIEYCIEMLKQQKTK